MEMLHRDLEDEIRKYSERREYLIVKGPRQAGKTTLLKDIYSKTSGSRRFVNLDNATARRSFETEPLAFVGRFKTGSKLTLFLDEVQKVNGAGEKLKLLYDEIDGLKVYASGSSSLEMRNNVMYALEGRAFVYELMTFSFGEFLAVRDGGLYKSFKSVNESIRKFIANGTSPQKPAFSDELSGHWKRYVVHGGYPEVVKANDDIDLMKTILKNIFDLYVDKDVVGFFKVEDTNKFIDFAKALSFNISNILNLSSLSSDLHTTHYMARQMLEVMSNTYMIKLVYPFFRNVVTELKKSPKLYFRDLGMRNYVLGNMLPFDNRDDAGKLTENFVFEELEIMGYRTKYWRTTADAEVDFVIEASDGIVPIEVKMGGTGALGRSFYSFINVYKPKRALIVTMNEFSEEKINGTKVFKVPAFCL